ncbi:ATP-binding cassette sub-family A member 12, partial [Arapaima gigas]
QMAFFHQLRLLLWKNALSVYRQPIWSLALIIWPLVIFLILAITRSQFPPQLQSTCYVAPRNLPSTGFFPFLQTLMCSTDSSCNNTSYQPSQLQTTKSLHLPWGHDDAYRLSLLSLKPPALANQQRSLRSMALEVPPTEQPQLPQLWDRILNVSSEDAFNWASSTVNTMNSTVLSNQIVNTMMDSMNTLKKSLCTASLSLLNVSAQYSFSPLTFGLIEFCKSNNTVLEVFLLIFNQAIMEVLLTNPMKGLQTVEEAVLMYDQLQLQQPLWNTLLGLPKLFMASSTEELLQEGDALLKNINRTAVDIQTLFPQAKIPVSVINPAMDTAVKLLQYIRNWPLNGVNISLSDFIKVPNNSAENRAEMAQQVAAMLQEWGIKVSPSDVAYAISLLNNLLNAYSSANQTFFNNFSAFPGQSNQFPVNLEDQGFLAAMSMALDILESLPGFSYINTILKSAMVSMELVAQILDADREQMGFMLRDSTQVQQVFLSLMLNESLANSWSKKVLNSSIQTVLKDAVKCTDLLAPWSWLSSLSSVDTHLWEVVLCNNSRLADALIAKWMAVVQKVNDLTGVFQGTVDFNVSASTLLSQWKQLNSSYEQFGSFWQQLFSSLDAHYWEAWTLNSTTVNSPDMTLSRCVLLDVIQVFGSELPKRAEWLSMEPYFHIAYWIMTYQPNVTTTANCTVDSNTMVPYCHTNFTWEAIRPLTQSVIKELSVNPTTLLSRYVEGSAAFLDGVYGDFVVQSLNFQGQLPGNGSFQDLVGRLIQSVQQDMELLLNVTSIDQFDRQLSLSILGNALDRLGLRPLEVIWMHGSFNASANISTVLEAVIDSLNMFSTLNLPLNQTSSSQKELKSLVLQWLSIQDSLSVPLAFNMACTLLNYSSSLNAMDSPYLKHILNLLNNENKTEAVKLVLKAMQILKLSKEASNNSSALILGYLQQLRDFLAASPQLYNYMQKINELQNVSNILYLNTTALEIFQLLSNGFIQDFFQTGNLTTTDAVLWKSSTFLPLELHYIYENLINNTFSLIRALAPCTATGQDCIDEVSQTFFFLHQAAELLQNSSNENLSNEVLFNISHFAVQANSTYSIVKDLLSVILSWSNSTNMSLTPESIQKTIHFFRSVSVMPNISLSCLEDALHASNFSLEELDAITQLAEPSSISVLLVDLMHLIDGQECFNLTLASAEHQSGIANLTDASCVQDIAKKTTDFLQGLPFPKHVQKMFMLMQDFIQFWSDQIMLNGNVSHYPVVDLPQQSLLNLTDVLDSIQMSLQNVGFESWPEISSEIQILKTMAQILVNGTYPYSTINSSLLNQPGSAQQVYVDIVQWYLMKLEDTIKSGNFSDLYNPLFLITEMQLATSISQSQFMASLVNKSENLVQLLNTYPNETHVSEIGQCVIAILRDEVELLKYSTWLHFYAGIGYQAPHLQIAEEQGMKYLNLTQEFLNDSQMTSTLNYFLQWNTSSLNHTNLALDHLVYLTAPFLSEYQHSYLSLVRQVSQGLKNILVISSQEDGFHSDNFTAAFSEIVAIVLGNLSTGQEFLPNPVVRYGLDFLLECLQFVFHPNMSFVQSTNVTQEVLLRGNKLLEAVVPPETFSALLPVTEVIITYLKTMSQPASTENWNQMHLPFCLDVSLSGAVAENTFVVSLSCLNDRNVSASVIFSLRWKPCCTKMKEFVNLAYTLLGGPDGALKLQSTVAAIDCIPGLLKIISGQADNETWQWAEKSLEWFFSVNNGTLAWETMAPAVPMFKYLTSAIAHNSRVKADFIYRLQEPFVLLMSILGEMNSSSLQAVLSTIQVVKQAVESGDPFECTDVLMSWAPVIEQTGISNADLNSWCNSSLEPLVKAYISNSSLFMHLNITGVTIRNTSGNIAVTDIVTELHSLYSAVLNQSHIVNQVPAQLSQPSLPPSNQSEWQNWVAQLLYSQLYQSTLLNPTSIKPVLDQVVGEAPWMQPYVLALDMALNYTLQNSLSSENTSVNPQLLKQALQIIFAGMNWTSDSINSILNGEVFSSSNGLFIDQVVKDTVEEILRLQMMGDWPLVYRIMEQFLTTKDTGMILQKAFELMTWWNSTEESGMEFVSESLMKIYEVVRSTLSTVIQMNFPIPSLYSNIFTGLTRNVVDVVRQIIRTAMFLSSNDTNLSNLNNQISNGMYLRDLLFQTHPSKNRYKRAATQELVDDFLDLAEIDYKGLLEVFSSLPSNADIMETIHIFFANPDLDIILKGVFGEFSGDYNHDQTISTALDVLSYVTGSGQWEKYAEMFMEISQQGVNLNSPESTRKLVETLRSLVDVGLVLAQQSSLEIVQYMDSIVKKLNPLVSDILEGQMGNHTSTVIQFLTGFNSILEKNIQEHKISKVSQFIKGIIATGSWQVPETNLTPYISALDKSVDEFASIMSPEQVIYFNFTAQMIKGFSMLVYYPRSLTNLPLSARMISDPLDYLLDTIAETTLPNGQSIQNVSYPLILNSMLITQCLWNLSSYNQTLGNQTEWQNTIMQGLHELKSYLPEEQRKYVLPLEPVVLLALAGVSNTAEIPQVFFNISSQVSASILNILNVTDCPGLEQSLFNISNLASSSLWNSLMCASSPIYLDVFNPLNQMIISLTPLLPPEGGHYIKASLSSLETMTISLNSTGKTGDIQGASSAIISSLQALLLIAPYPAAQPADNIFNVLQHTLQTVLQVISSDQGSLLQTTNITQLLLHDLYDMMVSANKSLEAQLTRQMVEAASLNLNRLLTMNGTNWIEQLLHVLSSTSNQLPNDVPYVLAIKNLFTSLANESQAEVNILLRIGQTASQLFATTWVSNNFTMLTDQLLNEVCALENMASVQQLYQAMSFTPGFLCEMFVPTVKAVQMIMQNLVDNSTAFSNMLFETFIGNPNTYQISTNWQGRISPYSLFFIVDTSSDLLSFVFLVLQGPANISVLLKNKTAFLIDVQKVTSISPKILSILMNLQLPSSNLEILSWLTSMHYCTDLSSLTLTPDEEMLFKTFCSLPPQEWYNFIVVVAQYISVENVIYRLMLTNELQSFVNLMLQMLVFLNEVMNKLQSSVSVLLEYVISIRDLNLGSNTEFRKLAAGRSSSISTKATFDTISKAMCSKGMLSVFGISSMPVTSSLDPSTQGDPKIEELIDKFNIPRDATPYCMNFFLDMVNTTAGAVAWAFVKPMLLGRILYTPDTPLTRNIIQKSNATLQEFANLRLFSQEWIKSSSSVMDSVQVLQATLPLLKKSLNNSFIQNFIQLQTNIDVNQMKKTLNSFSNITDMLVQNQVVLQQITTLSLLMMNLSSCVNFDRFQAFNSTNELNTKAEALAKTYDLFGSVIFKLPEGNSSSSRKKRDTSVNLPPRVEYTIRMNINNVMRTDRTRNPFWVQGSYISPIKTQRYNRGFVYLQESIERAIIEMQTGTLVEDPAVQLQAFSYPCYLNDRYLNSMSFAFPLVLMIAWVLFVAHFVKKLVQERELRLHEYMKMMGVNPASHFFAWFLESSAFLLVTIIILTIILKAGQVLPNSDGFLLFLFLCDYGLAILAISFLISSFFDKTNIAGLSGSLIYVICFFPFIVVMSLETSLSSNAKNVLSLFAPTCFSYASQYIARYENQGEGIQWSNSYVPPLTDDSSSFGWLCWLLFIDSVLYFLIGIYIRVVFPGKYGIAAPWYFPVSPSFWADLCGHGKGHKNSQGLLFTNIMQKNALVFSTDTDKPQGGFSSQDEEEFQSLPVGVSLHSLTKMYGSRAAVNNLTISFYESHVTALLGHNGAGKTTTMSLLTGLFAPSSGLIEVYGKDMQAHIDDIRKELGICMQYDVLFDHLTIKEHLLLYGQIKAPHWTHQELREQVRNILQSTGLYAHRHKRVGTLSGGMKRKLSISIAFIGGSRLVVLDEPTTGVDPCSRRAIWDIIIQHKKERTIILSTHHLDEAEVLSDRIAFLERGGLKCCGSPFYLKDKLGQGYNLILTKKVQTPGSKVKSDSEEVKAFVQSYIPEAQLKEGEVGDIIYTLPPFSSQNAVAYHSLLTNLDKNLDALQLGCYGISDTTLEEVFLQLTKDEREREEGPSNIITCSLTDMSVDGDGMPEELSGSSSSLSDRQTLTGSPTVRGLALFGQQVAATLLKRMHHSRRDWKGLFAQVLLPVLFVIAAMGLGSIQSSLQNFPELELSPSLYRFGKSYSFFSNQNQNSSDLVDTMLSFPGIDNFCLYNPDDPVCLKSGNYEADAWTSNGNSSSPFVSCKCTAKQQVCSHDNYQPPHKKIPSSQIVYNLTGINTENYLLATAKSFIRDRYGGFEFGAPLPADLKINITSMSPSRTLTKVWYNPEGYHSMPAFLNSLNNFILRSNLPADKDPQQYAISVSSYPYPGQVQDDDIIVKNLVYILVALCVLTGYSIMTASFVIYEVQEHHSGSKRLQHISGIGEPFYWAINFFYDMALYLIPVVLSVAVVAAFQLPAFSARQNLGAVTLLLLLFGFATFPWMYLLSGIFKDAEMAFISYVCINLFISINTIISTSVLYFLWQLNQNDERTQEVYQILCYVFLIFPQFSFGNGLMELARADMQAQILSLYGVDSYKNPFSMDMLGRMFVALSLQGFVFFSLRLLLNKFLMRKIRSLICPKKGAPAVDTWDEDEDVTKERHRVANGDASSDLLQVNQLSKVYRHMRKKFQAVKTLSVGIPTGECFGLLGVNGAGKTTTFKMLTGDISPTTGTAQIRNWDGRMVDIIDCRNKGISIGYCPQVDALDELLTAEEHLYFYARIRGISRREIDKEVNYLLRKLELDFYRNNISESYSCGTRRKLSTALALIGHPQILLLDEPSSGMDPRSKRHLWRIISEVKGKCAVVLTSHSMEECEALCTRLAIMVKGQFRCLGTLQHIKNRFGSGFTVKMHLAVTSYDVDSITNFMQFHFPSTYLKEQHSSMVEYHVPMATGGVADIFHQLEANKAALQIKHFSVSQTTLDEVFINFAMGKVGMETIPIDSEGSDLDSLQSTEDSDS